MQNYFSSLNIDIETIYWLQAILVYVIAYVIARITRKVADKFFDTNSKLIRVDPTVFNFFKNGLMVLIFLIASIILFYMLPPLKEAAQTLTIGATVLAGIAAFASQHALANIFGGFFIVLFKPFRVGDIIQIGTDKAGVVEDITLRHTVINNFENRRIIIPNSIISTETIVNSSIAEEKTCMHVEFGVSFDSDVDKAIRIIREEALKHPSCRDNRDAEALEKGDPQVVIRMTAWHESSVNLKAYVWADNPADGFAMKCDLFYSVKKRFDNEGVEIPYPHRTIVVKGNHKLNL